MAGATLRDVALRANVSTRTVSNVVNGYAAEYPHTRDEGRACPAELAYAPNVLTPSNLAGGRSGQIAVVVPSFDTPYFSELLRGSSRSLGFMATTS